MSMSKHTPGPWVRHPDYPWIIKQDLSPIADVTDGMTVCNTTAHENSGFFPTPDEGRANARLIAAAPELLAQLENILRAYGSEYESHSFNQWPEVIKARAAILNATGADE